MERTYEYELKDEELQLFRHPFQYLKKLDGKRYLEIYGKAWLQTLFFAFVSALLEKRTEVPVFTTMMPFGMMIFLILSILVFSRRICKKAILYNLAVRVLKDTAGISAGHRNMMMSVRVRGRKLLLNIKEFER